MNGRKARALRKQAANTTTESTSYTYKVMKTVLDSEGNSVPRITRRLTDSCQRAVYQRLKTA